MIGFAFHLTFYGLKSYLQVFFTISLLSLIVISHFNPVAYGESAEAYLFITPPMYVAKEIGEIFDVSVNISSVENLRSLEFTVTYNTSLLDVAQVAQGPFFPQPPRSCFEFEKNELLGFVKVNMSLADSETPKSGNGTLAYISFKVVQEPESCTSSTLNLNQTLLINSASTPIANDSVGAVYFWKSMQPDPPVEGRSLDLYTQRGGEGPDEQGGEFMTGETVYLTSLVTYNDYPVQQKLVSFEVQNPIDEIVTIRTTITDKDGLANTSFRIPCIPSSNGAWTAISVVDIAEKVVWDTLSFQVHFVPVGGYTFPIKGHTTEKPLTLYLALLAILTAVFTIVKRKTHKGLGRRTHNMMFTLTLLLLLVQFNILFGTSEGTDILITNFYSCDRLGDPQDYFPIKTTAYFNISVRNLAHDPKNISIYLSVHDELNVPIGLDQLNATVPPNVSKYYIMSIFIPKWAFVGIATAHASVYVEGSMVDSESTEFYIGPEDLTPPVIRLLSPENVTYHMEFVPLVFTVNERTLWMGYSLNNLENVSIAGNTTLTGLANGLYSITVYANDTSGNVGSSEEVYFTVLIMHDVAVINLKCSFAEVYVGQIVNITVSVQNKGTVTETFNVTTYANTTAIETLTVTNLFPSNLTTLVFTWNTTGFAKGNYTISAYAWPVPDETDTADNTKDDGTVNIMSRPDIAVTNVTSSRTLIGQGCSIPINATVRNKGDYTENFNVTAYANTTVIQTKTVTLTRGNSTTIIFTWNTTGFAKGNYTISAYAWPVPDEAETADNTHIDGMVLVTIPGDVNGDRKVSVSDLVRMINAVPSTPTINPEKWDPNADINCDGKVSTSDLVICVNYIPSGPW